MKHETVKIGMRVKTVEGAFPTGGLVGVVVENDGDPPERAPWVVETGGGGSTMGRRILMSSEAMGNKRSYTYE